MKARTEIVRTRTTFAAEQPAGALPADRSHRRRATCSPSRRRLRPTRANLLRDYLVTAFEPGDGTVRRNGAGSRLGVISDR